MLFNMVKFEKLLTCSFRNFKTWFFNVGLMFIAFFVEIVVYCCRLCAVHVIEICFFS